MILRYSKKSVVGMEIGTICMNHSSTMVQWCSTISDALAGSAPQVCPENPGTDCAQLNPLRRPRSSHMAPEHHGESNEWQQPPPRVRILHRGTHNSACAAQVCHGLLRLHTLQPRQPVNRWWAARRTVSVNPPYPPGNITALEAGDRGISKAGIGHGQQTPTGRICTAGGCRDDDTSQKLRNVTGTQTFDRKL